MLRFSAASWCRWGLRVALVAGTVSVSLTSASAQERSGGSGDTPQVVRRTPKATSMVPNASVRRTAGTYDEGEATPAVPPPPPANISETHTQPPAALPSAGSVGSCSPQGCTPSTSAPFEDQSLQPLTQNMPQQSTFDPGTGSLDNPNTFAAANSVGGYLDPAAPMNTFRLRYDNGKNSNYPDRGEYFYPQCGCFRAVGDPRAQGPDGVNRGVNFQQIKTYIEGAFSPRLSVFTELPATFVNYDVDPGDANFPGADSPGYTSGFGDMTAGFKYALLAEPDHFITFQLKTYIPTGDSYAGLGTGHVSIEPGILYYNKLGDRLIFQAELKDWQGLGVSSYASNVVEYGAGLGYIAVLHDNYSITPVIEMVGWTFIGGEKFNPGVGAPESASGDTIINVKPGVRFGFGGDSSLVGLQRHSIYAGWGHAITSDRLYEDLFRLEYRWLF